MFFMLCVTLVFKEDDSFCFFHQSGSKIKEKNRSTSSSTSEQIMSQLCKFSTQDKMETSKTVKIRK